MQTCVCKEGCHSISNIHHPFICCTFTRCVVSFCTYHYYGLSIRWKAKSLCISIMRKLRSAPFFFGPFPHVISASAEIPCSPRNVHFSAISAWGEIPCGPRNVHFLAISTWGEVPCGNGQKKSKLFCHLRKRRDTMRKKNKCTSWLPHIWICA